METITNCPQTGDNCTLCVELAEEEFGDELRGGGFDEAKTQNYIGNEKLQAQLHERGGASALSCEARRNRARDMGRTAGERLVIRSKAPGEI